MWPETLDALRRHGWRDYSLFVREQDGPVVGVVTCADFDASLAGMDAEPGNAGWQASIPCYFTAADRRPDQGMERLSAYFHLA